MPRRTAEIGLFDLVDIDAVIADFAVCYVIEAVDEVGDRGLARAGRADKGDLLPRLGVQRHIVQNDLIRIIAEVHIVKAHIAAQLRVGRRYHRSCGCFHAQIPVLSVVSTRLPSWS